MEKPFFRVFLHEIHFYYVSDRLFSLQIDTCKHVEYEKENAIYKITRHTYFGTKQKRKYIKKSEHWIKREIKTNVEDKRPKTVETVCACVKIFSQRNGNTRRNCSTLDMFCEYDTNYAHFYGNEKKRNMYIIITTANILFGRMTKTAHEKY